MFRAFDQARTQRGSVGLKERLVASYQTSPGSPEALRAGVAIALERRFGAPVTIHQVVQITEPDRRNHLFRVTAESSAAGLPATMIIKQIGDYDVVAFDSWDTLRFTRERVALEFLEASCGSGVHGPRFYGADNESGLVVIEDLGEAHKSLVDPLFANDTSAARTGLLAHMTSLGRMHADCANQLSAYQQIVSTVAPRAAAVVLQPIDPTPRIARVNRLLASRIEVPSGFETELAALISRISGPGPFRTFIHGDACPDNAFLAGETSRLIDFEFSRLGSALVDAVYPRMAFPTCWCSGRVPDALTMEAEGVYREELARGCPAARNQTAFDDAVSDACGYWVFITIDWLLGQALVEDEIWGTCTHRSLIVGRLRSFVSNTEQRGVLPALRCASVRLLAVLGSLWEDEETDLPVFPVWSRT